MICLRTKKKKKNFPQVGLVYERHKFTSLNCIQIIFQNLQLETIWQSTRGIEGK